MHVPLLIMDDKDQVALLYVYSLYSSEEKNKYLQYTAALVIFFYLKGKGHFPLYKDELLVYDYKESRRFLWEDKKFMNDINVVRSYDYLLRSRVKTSDYRDINAHLCTKKGLDFLKEYGIPQKERSQALLKELSCKCGTLLEVKLNDDAPALVCSKCKSTIVVADFLSDLSEEIAFDFKPAFL